MAGSSPTQPTRQAKRRRNIQGHTILAEPEMMAKLLRLSSATLSNLFHQARDQGMALLRLDDESFILTRQSDHTFTIIPHDQRNHPTL